MSARQAVVTAGSALESCFARGWPVAVLHYNTAAQYWEEKPGLASCSACGGNTPTHTRVAQSVLHTSTVAAIARRYSMPGTNTLGSAKVQNKRKAPNQGRLLGAPPDTCHVQFSVPCRWQCRWQSCWWYRWHFHWRCRSRSRSHWPACSLQGVSVQKSLPQPQITTAAVNTAHMHHNTVAAHRACRCQRPTFVAAWWQVASRVVLEKSKRLQHKACRKCKAQMN